MSCTSGLNVSHASLSKQQSGAEILLLEHVVKPRSALDQQALPWLHGGRSSQVAGLQRVQDEIKERFCTFSGGRLQGSCHSGDLERHIQAAAP